MMTEQQVVLIVVAAIIFAGLLIAFYVLKVVLPAQYRERMTAQANLNSERMALIERNMDPSLAEKKIPKGDGSNALLWGLLLSGIGMGAFFGYAISFSTGWNEKICMDALGLFFGGLGLVAYHLAYHLYKRKITE
ncbi:MAG TPA: DUF6249 domain-containing protein [Flavitalea sp.]|nr:DUF6249 domain-containing protein [Flavitalea sp.]